MLDSFDALTAFAIALAATAALTPLTTRFARSIGAIDRARGRGLAPGGTPLLGGLAIFAGGTIAAIVVLPGSRELEGILAAATLIVLVGALDDRFDLHPALSSPARRSPRRSPSAPASSSTSSPCRSSGAWASASSAGR